MVVAMVQSRENNFTLKCGIIYSICDVTAINKMVLGKKQMSKYKIKSKSTNAGSALGNMVTLGFYPKSYDYVVESNGSKRTINAFNTKDLGNKISKGKK